MLELAMFSKTQDNIVKLKYLSSKNDVRLKIRIMHTVYSNIYLSLAEIYVVTSLKHIKYCVLELPPSYTLVHPLEGWYRLYSAGEEKSDDRTV
jgi:hypothetical protein